MPSGIYKRYCNCCGKYYEGRGKFYCSHFCSSEIHGFKKGHKTNVGKKASKETKRKQSKAKMGDKNPMKRPEVSKKVADKNKGKKYPNRKSPPPFTEEHIKSMRENSAHYWLGKKRPDIVEKLRQANLGKEHSLESRKKRSEKMKGENNPSWIDGRSLQPYSENWTEFLKESIRVIDNHICQLCDKTQEEEIEKIHQRLNVHHIDYDKLNCDPKNLISLCAYCNGKVNSNRDYWEQYFKDIIQKRDQRVAEKKHGRR